MSVISDIVEDACAQKSLDHRLAKCELGGLRLEADVTT